MTRDSRPNLYCASLFVIWIFSSLFCNSSNAALRMQAAGYANTATPGIQQKMNLPVPEKLCSKPYRHEYNFRDVMAFTCAVLGIAMLIFGLFNVATFVSFTTGVLIRGLGTPFIYGSIVFPVLSFILGWNRDTTLSRKGVSLAFIHLIFLGLFFLGIDLINNIAGKHR